MTKPSLQLMNVLEAWPLDDEQTAFIQRATSGIGADVRETLIGALREAEEAAIACARWLEEGEEAPAEPVQQKRPPPVENRRRTPSMRFRPLFDRVIVRRIEAEAKSIGGLIIPDVAKEKPSEGEVVAVGPGARDEAGRLIPIDLKAGDRVLFGKWSGTEVKIDGVELLILKEADIMGVMDEVAEPARAKGAAA